MFHDVKTKPSRWNTTPERFVEIMERIAAHPNKAKVTITVDDAGKGNHQFMLPVFTNLGFKVHIFVPTAFISKGSITSSYMTAEQIKKFADLGHTIGSHSHTHPKNISLLSKEKIINEWKESKEILENITGKAVESCSIPGGFYSHNQLNIIKDLGYRGIFTSIPTFQVRKESCIQLHGRFSIERGTSIEQLESILKMDYFYQKKLRFRQVISQNVHTLKHRFVKNEK
jgi:peptidoglycan/xylan/chitin deacetylase (PgdA/CDA1 family)